MRRWLKATLLLCGTVGACSGANQEDPPPPTKDETTVPMVEKKSALGPTSCEGGTTRECTYYLPSHNGVRPCVTSEQTCVDGVWTQCGSLGAPTTVTYKSVDAGTGE